MIFNPTSGISTVTEQRMPPDETERTILQGLRDSGLEPQVLHTTPEDSGEGIARRAAADGAELVIAAGGDGTIHAVANGVTGTQSILGIIPTGTMNNLAHSLNIPDTIPAACYVVLNGKTRAIDTGRINDHPFLEVAGAGMEAALYPSAEEIKRPGLPSTLRGALSGLKTVFTYRDARVRIEIDGDKERIYTALQVTISNSPFYGAHLQVAPQILMDDGLLDVVVYSNFSKAEYLRHAVSISQGRRPYQPKIKHLRARSLRITADKPLEIQADGEPLGYTPAEVMVLPASLRIRVSGKEAPGLHVSKGMPTVRTSTPT
jgi:diacylglycerol kinase (ATP)